MIITLLLALRMGLVRYRHMYISCVCIDFNADRFGIEDILRQQ